MAITREKKSEILAKLSSILSSATSVVFVGFKGITGGDTTAMRRELKGEGVHYFVAKKRLVKKAIADTGVSGNIPELEGELAIAYTEGEDTTAPARLIHENAKKHEGLSILGGVFESALADAAKMTEIATIPPTPVLRGMFVNVINSPIQGFAVALKAIADKKGE
ncbi:MAG: 50S ribosomal protein L10 [Patescibacteria group bacterium UBA2103]